MKTITVKSKYQDYEVLLKDDLLLNLSQLIDPTKKTLIITDENVARHYLSVVKSQFNNVFTHVIKPGEKSKTLNTATLIWQQLIAENFGRQDQIIALGGGVVCDLAGYVASQYLRGISYYNIATSLLAQVDSSIGGKVAIDFCQNKNNLGSFYPPKKVIIDFKTLNTLDQKELQSGLSEVIKYGLTLDFSIIESLNQIQDISQFDQIKKQVIFKSLMIKKHIVEVDEKEQNVRKILNFGHTFGHGIESYLNFEMRHGFAVAQGMLIATLLGESLKINNFNTVIFVKDLLIKFGLLTDHPLVIKQAYDYILKDKKVNADTIDFIFINDQFEPCITPIKTDLIKDFVNNFYDYQGPSSKSMTHRQLLLSLFNQKTVIENYLDSQDTNATIQAIINLGAIVESQGTQLTITAPKLLNPNWDFDANESGTTLRMCMALGPFITSNIKISGAKTLISRPHTDILNCYESQNISLNIDDLINVKGTYQNDNYVISSDKSSQFLSGLLIGLASTRKVNHVKVEGLINSQSYVNMTIECLENCGVIIVKNKQGYMIDSTNFKVPDKVAIETDFSQISFLIVASIITNRPMVLRNINLNSSQGDSKILEIIKGIGTRVLEVGNNVIIIPTTLNCFEVDINDIPDLGPILSVLAANCNGTSVIKNISRLSFKESDRVLAIVDLLKCFKIDHAIVDNSIYIKGKKSYSANCEIKTHNDHRILMSAKIMDLNNLGTISFDKEDVFHKSYPLFEKDYQNFRSTNE